MQSTFFIVTQAAVFMLAVYFKDAVNGDNLRILVSGSILYNDLSGMLPLKGSVSETVLSLSEPEVIRSLNLTKYFLR